MQLEEHQGGWVMQSRNIKKKKRKKEKVNARREGRQEAGLIQDFTSIQTNYIQGFWRHNKELWPWQQSSLLYFQKKLKICSIEYIHRDALLVKMFIPILQLPFLKRYLPPIFRSLHCLLAIVLMPCAQFLSYFRMNLRQALLSIKECLVHRCWKKIAVILNTRGKPDLNFLPSRFDGKGWIFKQI